MRTEDRLALDIKEELFRIVFCDPWKEADKDGAVFVLSGQTAPAVMEFFLGKEGEKCIALSTGAQDVSAFLQAHSACVNGAGRARVESLSLDKRFSLIIIRDGALSGIGCFDCTHTSGRLPTVPELVEIRRAVRETAAALESPESRPESGFISVRQGSVCARGFADPSETDGYFELFRLPVPFAGDRYPEFGIYVSKDGSRRFFYSADPDGEDGASLRWYLPDSRPGSPGVSALSVRDEGTLSALLSLENPDIGIAPVGEGYIGVLDDAMDKITDVILSYIGWLDRRLPEGIPMPAPAVGRFAQKVLEDPDFPILDARELARKHIAICERNAKKTCS